MKGSGKFTDIFNFEKISQLLIDYIDIKAELLKVQAKEELAKIISAMLLIFLILGLVLFSVFFASLSLGMFINYMLESEYIGFLIVTGLYVLICIIAYNLKDSAKMKALYTRFLDSIIDASEDDKK